MITFDGVIADFALVQQQQGKGRSYLTYKKKVEVLRDYAIARKSANDSNFSSILRGLDEDDILDSVRFYVEDSEIRYKATADAYYTILTVFFDFIRQNYQWGNVLFDSKEKNTHLQNAYNILTTKELKLNAKEKVLPPDDLQVEELIQLCNYTIQNTSTDAILGGAKNGAYSKYISSLIVKLTLLLGCKNQVVDNLLVGDYDPFLHTITVNGYCVHVSNGLAKQMYRYIAEVRPKLVELHPNEHLFVGFKDNAIVDNSKKYAILKPVLGHTKGTAIAKYAIMRMIREKVPAYLIMEFTGCSTVIYRHCNELVEDESDTTKRASKSRLLDQAFRGTSIYDRL